MELRIWWHSDDFMVQSQIFFNYFMNKYYNYSKFDQGK